MPTSVFPNPVDFGPWVGLVAGHGMAVTNGVMRLGSLTVNGMVLVERGISWVCVPRGGGAVRGLKSGVRMDIR
jgi:hypothetical protein